MTVRVFISYRRDDSRHLAGRLRDQLVVAFGAENVFFDVDSIPFGMDFRKVIGDRIATVDVVLALIGPRYAPEQLAQANDMVRMELTTAFEQGKVVVPVLLEGAPIPLADELPDDLEQLAYLHAAPLRPDPDFHPDTQRLVEGITTTLADARDQPPAPTGPPQGPVERPVPSRPTPGLPYDQSVAPRRWTLIDNKGGGQALAVAFSRDSRFVASGGIDYTLRVWEVANGKLICSQFDQHRNRIYSLAWSPTADIMAGASYTRDLRLWDASAGFEARVLDRLKAVVRCLAWAPDGSRLVTGGPDGSLRTFDMTGHVTPTGVTRAHTGGVSAVAWSPDGRLIASGGWDQDPTVRLWDPDGTAFRTLRGHTRAVRGIAFVPDGTQLVTASIDNTVRIWDVASGELVTSLTGGRQNYWNVAVSPDGRLVAAGGHGKRIEVWDRPAEQLVWSLTGLTTVVHDVAFSPDGKYLASAGGFVIRRRTQVILWELGG